MGWLPTKASGRRAREPLGRRHDAALVVPTSVTTASPAGARRHTAASRLVERRHRRREHDEVGVAHAVREIGA